jgi:hypothetical protein
VWWAGAARLRRTWDRHEVAIYAGGDEPEHRALCAAHGGTWVEHQNTPLGLKWNALVRKAWLDGADATVILGSDDLLDSNLADAYRRMFDAGRPAFYAGNRGCAMVEPATRRALYIGGHATPGRLGEVVGAGRVFARSVLDRLQGRPWPQTANRGLDFRQTMNFVRAGVHAPDVVFGPEDGLLVDIKTDANIWSYNHIARHRNVVREREYDRVLERIPERVLFGDLEADVHKVAA